MGRIAPLRDLEGGPAWMQVVHDLNVSNKLRGTRMPRAKLLSGFESVRLDLNGQDDESQLKMAAENLTLGTARVVMDRVAQVLRAIRR
jgi:hypothetical protein